MKLKRATYRHIEAEIYAYYDTLKAIEELRADIILAGRQEVCGAVVWVVKTKTPTGVEEVLTDIIPQVGVEAWIMCVRLKKSYITTGI